MNNDNLVDIEGFGKQKLILCKVDGTDDICIGTFNYNKNKYIGVLDKNGHLLVPFSTKRIIEILKTNDNLDYCFTIGDSSSLQSYHISKEEDFYRLIMVINGNSNNNARLIGTEVDNYWLAKYTGILGDDYAIYDVKRRAFISPFVTTIKFRMDKSSPIFAYLEKKIATILDGEEYDFTTLACYINQDGSFISPLLDMEEEVIYETKTLNFDPEFCRFNNYVASILRQYQQKFYEKQERISEILNEMMQEHLSENALKLYKYDTKIIPFIRGDGHDKK